MQLEPSGRDLSIILLGRDSDEMRQFRLDWILQRNDLTHYDECSGGWVSRGMEFRNSVYLIERKDQYLKIVYDFAYTVEFKGVLNTTV